MKITIVVPICITLLLAVLTFNSPLIINEQIETLLLDYRFQIRNLISPPTVPDDTLIVAIDEQSVSSLGRWPWSRKLQSQLIRKVMEGGPKAAAVDIFYPQSESPEADVALADVLNLYGKNLIAALSFEVDQGKTYEGEVEDVLYDHAVSKIQSLKYLHSLEAHRVVLPPEPIASSSTFGHVNTLQDMDGKLRRENLYIKYGDEYFFSLALRTAAAAMGIANERISIAGGSGVDVDGRWIPTDEFGRIVINYIGKERSFEYVSAADVLSGDIPDGLFKNKIVLIGTSAIATYDSKITPFAANMPGVEKNATVISNIISGDYIVEAPLYLDLIVVLIAGFAAIFMTHNRRAAHSIIYYASWAALVVIINQAVFTLYKMHLNLIYPLAAVLGTGTFVISHRYFIEEKKAREIRKMFSSYVTERVVNELIKNPELAKLGGSRREVTVLFSDITGFTKFSEDHAPEFVVEMLNEYLTAMTDIVFHWEGTLDKFIGDAIVAFWGAPLEQDDHAERAVRCALHMIKKLDELKQKWVSEGKTPLSVGIGLNTGEVLVGNIGAEGKKMDYTVIGDHVNLGSRVESLTRKYDSNILMTELPLGKIRELVDANRIGHVSISGVGNVVVKGRKGAVKIYKIQSLEPSADSFIAECEDDTVVYMKDK